MFIPVATCPTSLPMSAELIPPLTHGELCDSRRYAASHGAVLLRCTYSPSPTSTASESFETYLRELKLYKSTQPYEASTVTEWSTDVEDTRLCN